MARRRSETVAIALLLLGCVGAIVFVFLLMQGPGGAFEMRPPSRGEEPPRAVAPTAGRTAGQGAARSSPAAVPGPSAAGEDRGAPDGTEDAPEPAVPPVAADGPETGTEESDAVVFSDEPARLTLELLAPPEQEDRTIQVGVVDATGAPVGAALVVVRERDAILYRVRTDSQGVALFRPYPDEKGPFRIDALAKGFVPGTAPAVAAGADTQLILEALPIVTGEIVGLKGVHGVIRLFHGAEEQTMPIGPDGSFRFEELEAGEYTVQAEVEQYGTMSETFRLENGTMRYVRLRVTEKHPTRIYGQVQGWNTRGALWINGVSVPVNPSGSYVFEHAVVGFNEVLIDIPGRALARERFQVAALEKSQHNFRTVREARIFGRVRKLATNQNVEGAQIRVGFARDDPRNDRVPLFPIDRMPEIVTDHDGRFEIGRLDGRLIYLLSVTAPGFGQALVDAVPDGGFHTIGLPEGPFLYGKLRGLGGLPRGAVVTATPLEPPLPGAVFSRPGWDRSRSERDREGFYGLSGLLPGTYRLRVDAPEFGSVETIVDLFAGERARLDLRLRRGVFADDDEGLLLSRLPPVAPDAAEEPVLHDTTIMRIDARRPVSEVPFAGVEVRFFEGDLEFAPPMEFHELEFELTGLPEATYRAVLEHPNLKKTIVQDHLVLRRGLPLVVEFR